MNFSSSLMSGMGISLGGLEIATDFLYANPDFYEPELTEIKTTLSNKPKESLQKNVKTVKPKVTRETIINKFSLIKTKTTLVSDEVIDNSNLVREVDDFDFSFDTNVISFDKQEDIEANSIMQKIESAKNCKIISEDTDNSFEINIEDSNIENIDFEDDTESYEDLEDSASFNDIDNLDFELSDEEDDESLENNIDLLDFDSDVIGDEDALDDESNSFEDDTDSFSLDDLDSIEDIDIEEESFEETTKKPSKTVKETSSIDTKINIDIEGLSDEGEDSDEEDGFSIDDLDLLDDFEDDIDIIESATSDKETEISKEQDVFDIEDLDLDFDDASEIKKEIKENKQNSHNQEKTSESSDIDILKSKLADMEKQMQSLKADKTSKNTSELKKKDINFNKDDSLDALIKATKPSSNKDVTGSKYDRYTVLNVDQLYTYVKNYMIQKGVQRSAVDISILNEKFGEANIKKLIQKSYLIKIGKGVTTGR